jgi:signal transduction histidine kinase
VGTAVVHPRVEGVSTLDRTYPGAGTFYVGRVRSVGGWSRSDALVAAGVLAIAVAEVTASAAISPKAAALPCELVMAIALLWRRRLPLAVAVVVAAAQVVEAAAGVPLQQPVVPVLASVIAVYALMTRANVLRMAVGSAALLSAVGIETALQHKGFGNFAFALIFLVGAAIVGRTVHARTAQTVQLQARADTLEREGEVRVQLAAQEERARIARELHDVIAHSVSVMVVQAGAAEQMMTRNPARALTAVQTVQATGRDALGEMGRLLGILREGMDELGLSPQPGLGDVPALIADARHAGLAVELQIIGEQRSLPPGPALSIYRIVQEGLTNVRKHASSTRAAVRLIYSSAGVDAEVTNTGGETTTATSGGGHGLIGMRERVAVYGGTLQAGPRDGGGYHVHAHLPLETQQ